MASAVAMAVLGACDAADAEPEPMEPRAQDDGGSDGAGDGGRSEQDAGADPRQACPVARELQGLVSTSCPDIGAFGMPCNPPGERCIGYHRQEWPFACEALCGEDRAWRVTCSSVCKHDCSAPSPETAVTELDVSDCSGRSLTRCLAGPFTLQGELDNHVAALVLQHDPEVRELRGDTLVVQFENGCPARFYSKDRGELAPGLESFMRSTLARLRLSCAIPLPCSETQGQ